MLFNHSADTIANATFFSNSNLQLTDSYGFQDDLPMSADPNIVRLARLKAEVEKTGGNVAAFAKAHPGMDETYIRQLLNGHRNFGERAARNMGAKYFGSPDYFTADSPIPTGDRLIDRISAIVASMDVSEQARLLVNLETGQCPIDRREHATGPPPVKERRRA